MTYATTMQYGEVQGIDEPVSRLVLGTIMFSMRELEKGFDLLDAVFELGCNTFDTAHIYAGGDSERVLGRWMAERGVRDKVIIIGKGAHHNADRRRVTPFDITSDLHDSLARLKVDCIDVYLLHRDDLGVAVGPIVEVLNEHLQAGLIRAFGGSNWTHERIQEANEYAEAHGLVPFVASSPNFSLAEQVEEPWEGCVSIGGPAGAAARQWYSKVQMPLFAWSSLGRGFLSGRISRENFDAAKGSLDESCLRAFCCEQNFKRLDRVQVLAQEQGVTVPQIALAFLVNQPLEIFPLVGCYNRQEFEANVAALGLRLTPGEMAWLDLQSDNR